MATFWLATFDFEPDAGLALAQPFAMPLAQSSEPGRAIEIIRDGGEWAVLFSTVDNASSPGALVCWIGFASATKPTSIWRDRGFPLTEAKIEYDESADKIVIYSYIFCENQSEMQYQAELFSISGLASSSSSSASKLPAAPYIQPLQIADPVFSATHALQRPVPWSPKRAKGRALAPGSLKFDVQPTRWPCLTPFSGLKAAKAGWQGEIELPKWPSPFPAPTGSVSRSGAFGLPFYRFEDVEALGFRIDLGGASQDKYLELIRRLNFHLDQRLEPIDFQYRPATRILNLELLRYGKMKMMEPLAPLTDLDFQSQHELVIRVLVGRVDDDSAQGQDPATYVPAIFVDNSWSKALGRDVLGLDKRLAHFCVDDGTGLKSLAPNGRLPAHDTPEALASITEVRLAANTALSASDPRLMTLDCPYKTFDGWNDLQEIDLNLVYGPTSMFPFQWRQDDFEDAEFRRSFAQTAMVQSLYGFRSVQVSPVGEKALIDACRTESTWIKGTFSLVGPVEFAQPQGVVALTLHDAPAAPQAWRIFCDLLGAKDDQARLYLPTGSWYRMRCSMDLTLNDGFA